MGRLEMMVCGTGMVLPGSKVPVWMDAQKGRVFHPHGQMYEYESWERRKTDDFEWPGLLCCSKL